MEMLRSKNSGFSLIELIVAITIVAIIGVLGVPAIGKLQDRVIFDRESQALIEAIRDVRNYALTSKKCADGTTADFWGIQLYSDEHTDDAKKNTYQIQCGTSPDHIIDSVTSHSDILRFSAKKSTNGTFASVFGGDTRIRYYTNPFMLKLIDGTSSEQNHWYDTLGIVTGRGAQKKAPQTICLHRIQGFIQILPGEQDCP